jgi:hypothetical protein
MKRTFSQRFIASAVLIGAALGTASVAHARPDVFVSIGLPGLPVLVPPPLPRPFIRAEPVYVYQRPVYEAAPVVVYERPWRPRIGTRPSVAASGDITNGSATNAIKTATACPTAMTATAMATACPTATTTTVTATACPTATTVAPTTRIAAEPEQDGRAERASNQLVTTPKKGEAKAEQRMVVERARLQSAVVS